ncbi:MAG: DUF4398 domain-containing protein [bacterium]|nr:DUF4398 domain-containing protein [bacterium]
MLKYKHIFSFLVLVIFFAGCGDPIPISEMTNARKEISRALSVKADKYAPEEIEAAQNKLFASHDEIKNDDLDKAAKAAGESNQKATEAYNKAIPLLAKDTIAIAEKSYEEATEVYGEKLAEEEYGKAGEALKKANDQFGEKKFYDAYLSALEADKIAKAARNTSISKKGTLQDAITDVEYSLDKAKNYDADKHSPEKYNLAQENLNIAKESLENLQLKKGFAAVEVAKINAGESYVGAISGTANDKIAAAETAVSNAEKSEGAAVAVDELAASKEMLASAKSMNSESKYKESIEFSDEAVKLSNIVAATKKSDIDGLVGEGSEDDKDFRQYKVRLHDYLRKISTKYYRDEMLWKHIFRENTDKIKNPDLIYPGWILKVPKLNK